MPIKTPNILTLDLSFSNCGWAAISDGAIESGRQSFDAWPLKTTRCSQGVPDALRFHWFGVWLEQMLGLQAPDAVIIERAHLRGWAATQMAVGLGTRVEEVCAVRGIAFDALHTATLKKWATGHGKAEKSAMRAAAAQRFAHYFGENDEGGDEADALNLLAWALEQNE